MDVFSNNVISIIVPLYYGNQYIPRLIHEVEVCKKKAGSLVKVELILSNDAPDSKIEANFSSDIIDILILNTTENRGIQGARVRGLKAASGDYIVFLDQDDILRPDYIRSQLFHIGDADAVVCRCIHEAKQFYNADMRLEEVITK